MRQLAFVIPVVLLTLTGCGIPEDDWGMVKEAREALWDEMPWWSVIWRLTLWTFLGVSGGAFIGIFLTILLRRWGAYRLPWARVRFWLTLLIFILNIIAMPLLCGGIGFLEGSYRAIDVAVRHGIIGKKWLPKLAEIGADAILLADRSLEKEEFDLEAWEEIQKARKPFNAVAFLDGLEKLKEESARLISEKAKEKIFEKNPEWKGEFAETVIDWTIPPLINYLLNRKLHKKLEEHGVPDLLSDLRREATKDGDELLTHQELTAFLTDRILIEMLLYPVRQWLGGIQKSTFLIILAWFVTPVILMFITRWIAFWWKRRAIRRMCADKL